MNRTSKGAGGGAGGAGGAGGTGSGVPDISVTQLQHMLEETEVEIDRKKLIIGLNQPKRFG